jgi:hypothetical protein
MGRPLFAAFLLIFGCAACLPADEPAEMRSSQRKLAIDNMLDSPLNWELGDREHVTLAALLDHIRQDHHLTVRWDLGSLGLIFSDDSPLEDLFSTSFSGQTTCPPSSPLHSATTHLWATPSAYTAGQLPQQFDPYALPGQTPVLPAPSIAVGSRKQGTDGQVRVPASALPKPSQPISNYPETQQPAPQAPKDRADVPSSAAPLSNQPATSYPETQPPSLQAPNDSGDVPRSGAPSTNQPAVGEPPSNGLADKIAVYQTTPILLTSVSFEGATVRQALQQMLDAAFPSSAAIPFQIGFPITTRAMTLDLLVDENSVLITTRLRANAKKETRIYRLGALSEIPPESLERVITHSIRPWSWRTQANEIAEQLATRWPKSAIPLPKVELNATEGIKLISNEQGADPAADAMPEVSAETVAAAGQLVAGGALAIVQSTVAAMEIVHHGDPPTGVIESLPGVLIITQSQAAHREIKELLDELGQIE